MDWWDSFLKEVILGYIYIHTQLMLKSKANNSYSNISGHFKLPEDKETCTNLRQLLEITPAARKQSKKKSCEISVIPLS